MVKPRFGPAAESTQLPKSMLETRGFVEEVRGAALCRNARLRWSWGALAFALLFGHAHAAQQNIGATETVKNDVSRQLSGAAARLNVGDPVFRSEIVLTGAESTSKLVFLDSTNLAIGPISRVVLDRFVYDGGEIGADGGGQADQGPVPLHHRRARQERLFRNHADSGDRRARHDSRHRRHRADDQSHAARGSRHRLPGQPGRGVLSNSRATARTGAAATAIAPSSIRWARPRNSRAPTTAARRRFLTPSAVDFAALCGGDLCETTDYAALTNGTDLASAIDGSGGGAALCGR